MPMGPRISAYRIFFDVRADGVGRKMQQDAARPLATCTVIDQLKSWNIGNEIRIPRAMTLDDSALAAEISLFATEAIGKCKGVVENEMHITKPVDHHRRVGKRDEPRRLISLNVEMLAPGIERWREHAALLPFEGLLTAPFSPNARRAAALDDVDQFCEETAFRESLALRGDFTYITVATTPRPKHVDKRAESSLTFPRLHRHRRQIVDGEPLVNRRAFGVLPYFIGRLIEVCGILGKIQTHFHPSLR